MQSNEARVAYKTLSWGHEGLLKKVAGFVDRIAEHHQALTDLLAFYDRAAGSVHDQSGCTANDVLRIAEIRKLAAPVTDHQSPVTEV